VSKIVDILYVIIVKEQLLVTNGLCYSGENRVGDQYRLLKVHKHKLERTAYNMVHGPFGAPKDTCCIDHEKDTCEM